LGILPRDGNAQRSTLLILDDVYVVKLERRENGSGTLTACLRPKDLAVLLPRLSASDLIVLPRPATSETVPRQEC
jgi:hypothetical protein